MTRERSAIGPVSAISALRAAIAELEYAIAKLVAELKALQESDGVSQMEAAVSTEAEWQRFFEQQEHALGMELVRLVSELLTAHAEEIESND